ncbi:hypothetical protein M0802_003085 [Mischocyttarus mexicanus]|nr:hypothetical protein M0802_003085 [Mischocyttarus mexicanus]
MLQCKVPKTSFTDLNRTQKKKNSKGEREVAPTTFTPTTGTITATPLPSKSFFSFDLLRYHHHHHHHHHHYHHYYHNHLVSSFFQNSKRPPKLAS